MLRHRRFICIFFYLLLYNLLAAALLSACRPAHEIAQNQPSYTVPAQAQIIPSATASQTSRPAPTTTVTPTPWRTEDSFKETMFAIIRKSSTTPRNTLPPSITPTRTQTPTPTMTLPVFQPVSTQQVVGTPMPGESEVISATNFARLTNVAQWGRGKIVDIGFTPDGKTFIAGSQFGLAIYQTGNYEAGPRWIAFQQPIVYTDFEIDAQGLIKLNFNCCNTTTAPIIYDFVTGQVVTNVSFNGTNINISKSGYGELSVRSPDGSKEFQSSVFYKEGEGDREFTALNVFDAQDNFLFSLKDSAPELTYSERNSPEGCDLEVFSMCGNALAPVAIAPYKAAFSLTGQSLTILYRSPAIGNPERFSTLRTYQAKDGKLLQIIGNKDQPVLDFAYIPGQEAIMVAFLDGTIQQWAIGGSEASYTFQHFSSQIWNIAYSYDGKYLLVLRPNELEVRRSRDGLMIAQYEATAFSISPTSNRVAVGHQDGKINIEDLDRLATVQHLEGHTGPIYALAFSPDGLLLTSSAEDCRLRVWDAQKGIFLHYLEQAQVNAYEEIFTRSRIFVYSMEFIPGTNRLAGFGSWATMVSWDINSGAAQFVVKSQPLEYYNGIMTLKPHFPESYLLDPANNRFFIDNLVYSLQNGTQIGPYQPPDKLAGGCSETGPVTADGKVRFSRGYDGAEGRICILDAGDFHALQTIQVLPDNIGGMVGWPVLSPNGKQLVVPLYGGQIYVYQIEE